MITKTQGERFMAIEKDVSYIKAEIDNISCFIKNADAKYADKSIEQEVRKMDLKMAYWAGAIAVILVVIEIGLRHFGVV